jgi:hypothetical protein
MNKVKTTKVKATAKKKVTTAKPKAKATTATKKKTTTAKPKATATKKATTAKPKVKATATKKATATTKKKVTTAKPKAKATTTKKATAKPKVKTTTAKKPATKKATTKKATAKVKATATTKKKTTTAKPAVKRAGPKFKRGYKVTLVNKELVLDGVRDLYELYEVTGPKVDKTRWFVDEESVQLFIAKCEQSHIEANALAGKGHQFVKGVISETKELMAASELPELNSEVADDRYVAKNKEDNDK